MSSDKDNQPNAGRDAAVAATTSALVGAIAMYFPVLAIPAAMVKDFADPMVVHMLDQVGSLRQRRAQATIGIAAAEAGMPVSRLTSTIEESSELLTLMAQVVQAAAETPLEAKLIALGRSLGRGVANDALVDAEFVKVRGLAAIETFDVKLMEALGAGEPARVTADAGEAARRDNLPGWRREDILLEHHGFAAVLDALISRLAAQGMVRDQSIGAFGGGPERWALTPFGEECLALLTTVPSPAPAPQNQE